MAGAGQAKTLVYCSEGSPEGFDPAPWTAGTTFDAASRPVYDRLIEFKKGSTETEPGLAESWEVSEDGTEITFHLRPGVKFQTTDWFTPTREMNADDVVFTFMRQFDKAGPWYEYAPGIAWEYFNSTMASLAQGDRQGRRHDGEVRAQPAGRHRPRHLPDGLRLDRLQGVRRPARGRRHQGAVQRPAGRHRALHLRRLPAGRGDPLPGQSRLVERQAADRRPDLRDHRRRRRAPAEARRRRMRHHPLSEPGRHRGAEGQRRPDGDAAGRLQHRLSRLQHPGGAVRQARGAQGAEQGDQQAGDHRRRLPGRRHRRGGAAAADLLGLQRRTSSTIPTTRRRPRPSSRRRASPASR